MVCPVIMTYLIRNWTATDTSLADSDTVDMPPTQARLWRQDVGRRTYEVKLPETVNTADLPERTHQTVLPGVLENPETAPRRRSVRPTRPGFRRRQRRPRLLNGPTRLRHSHAQIQHRLRQRDTDCFPTLTKTVIGPSSSRPGVALLHLTEIAARFAIASPTDHSRIPQPRRLSST